MEQKKFEEAEHIFGWREMEPGYWYFINKEVRGMNKWQKPISVVTVKLQLGGPSIKFYARLHYTLGLKADQTPRSFCMKAWFNLKLATSIQNLSMLLNYTNVSGICRNSTSRRIKEKEKKSFSFFVI